MEPIALTFQSPPMSIPGLDETIVKLERVEVLTGMLGKRQVVIDVRTNGADQLASLGQAVKQFQELVRASGAPGSGSLVQNFIKGAIGTPDALRGVQGMIASMKAEAALVEQAIASKMGAAAKLESQRAVGSPMEAVQWRQKFATVQADIQKYSAQGVSLNSSIAMLERAAGIGGILNDMHGSLSQKVEATAGAEAALAGKASMATEAMAAQAAVAERKAKLMNDLAAAVERTTQADHRNTDAARRNAQANSGGSGAGAGAPGAAGGAPGALLQRREQFERDEEGNLVRTGAQNTWRTGSGRKTTVDEMSGDETRLRNEVQRHRDAIARLLAEYKQNMAAAAPLQKAALSTQLAGDLRGLHAGMGTLGEDAFGQSVLGRAGKFEGDALRFQDQHRLEQERAAARARKEADERLKQGHAADKLLMKADEEYRARQAMADATAAADAGFAAFRAGEGVKTGKPKETLHDDGTRTRRTGAAKENWWNGLSEGATLVEKFDAAGNRLSATLQTTNNSLNSTGRGVTNVGSTMMRNLASVTTWTAAVGVLYGTLGLLKKGFEDAVTIDRSMATLRAVYRGSDEGAKELTNTTLGLAVANGRSASEAMDSAVKWGRLGLVQKEAAEAVRVSLMAANVSELTVADSTEHLSAMMNNYRLSASDLIGVLNAMNSVSNNLNVTVGDLMEGISRVGPLAKQSGMGLTELMGLIGAAKSATGRPGSEFGNTIKAAIISFNNPEVQKKLQTRFGFDVYQPTGEMKTSSDILAGLWQKTQGMSRGAKGELLQVIGGKQQGSRLEAILDNYVTAEMRASAAALDFNSAQREGNLILDTTASKVTALGSAWSRAWNSMYQGTGMKTVVNRSLEAMTWVLGGADDKKDPMEPLNRQWADAGRKRLGVAQLVRSMGIIGKDPSTLKERDLREMARTVGGALGMGIEETEALGGELSGLRGKPELSSRLGDLQKRVRGLGDDASGGERQAAMAIQTKLRQDMEAASAQMRKSNEKFHRLNGTREGHFAYQAYERASAEHDRIAKQLEEFESKKTTLDSLSDQEWVNVGPAGQGFQRTSSAQVAALGMFANEPAIGDTEADKLAARAKQVARQRSLAGQWDDVARRGLFQGMPINADARKAMGDRSDELREQALNEEILLKEQGRNAPVLDAERRGGEDTARRMGAYGSGTNATERIADTLKGAQDLKRTIEGMQAGAEREGAMITLGNTMIGQRNELLARQFSIVREIADVQLQQNREAGRALLFAGHSEALQASGLQEFLATRGRASKEVFSGWSPELRQIAERYVPGVVPEEASRLGELVREQKEIAAGKDRMLGDIGKLIDDLKKNTAQPLLGNVDVHIDIGKEFSAFTGGLIDKVMKMATSEFSSMRTEFGEALERIGFGHVGADAMINGL